MDGLFGAIAVIGLVFWIVTRHTLWCLPVIVSLAILAEDDWYPLSYFPMYSDPDESENYLYVATFENDPAKHTALPIHQFTALSAPKVKKMEDKYREDYAKKHQKKERDLDATDISDVGNEVLNKLREVAKEKGNSLPEKLALVEVWIVATDDGGWTETPGILAAQGAGQVAEKQARD